MKRNVTAEKEKGVKSPVSTKSSEKQFGSAMASMIDMMGRIYLNQVLLELNKSTVEKFEDAQSGNYAKVLLTMSNRVNRKLVKRFSNKRLERLSKDTLSEVDKRNQKLLYKDIEKSVGINAKELLSTEGLSSTTNALYLETTQWAKKLRDDSLAEWTNNTLRLMAQGESLTGIIEQFKGMEEKRRNHAHFVARQQVVTFNSLMTKMRAQNIGITKAKWVTSHDERVRPSHQERNGKEFDLGVGLYSSSDGKTLLPGIDYGCRCDYILIIPESDAENS